MKSKTSLMGVVRTSLLSGALSLCLVSTARAQNNPVSVNPGINRILSRLSTSNTPISWNILLPPNTGNWTFDVENVGAGAFTYTVTFATAAIEFPNGTGGALACTKAAWNTTASVSNGVASLFSNQTASVGTGGDEYTCPAPPHGRAIVVFSSSTANQTAAIYVIVNTAAQPPSLTQLPVGNIYSHINTATNTQVKTGTGVLHNLTINTTAAGAITVFDNSSCAGTVIAAFAASATIGTYTYDVTFNTGLCITTAAASDVTVSAR